MNQNKGYTMWGNWPSGGGGGPIPLSSYYSSSSNNLWVNRTSTPIVGHPHVLQIMNKAEDYGQDDYEEDYDWIVLHHPECEKRMESMEALSRLRYPVDKSNIVENDVYDTLQSRWFYVCEMAKELNTSGLQNLEMKWEDMEVGQYQIGLESMDLYRVQYTSGAAPPPPLYYRIRLL